jgi:hypothetical protein
MLLGKCTSRFSGFRLANHAEACYSSLCYWRGLLCTIVSCLSILQWTGNLEPFSEDEEAVVIPNLPVMISRIWRTPNPTSRFGSVLHLLYSEFGLYPFLARRSAMTLASVGFVLLPLGCSNNTQWANQSRGTDSR